MRLARVLPLMVLACIGLAPLPACTSAYRSALRDMTTPQEGLLALRTREALTGLHETNAAVRAVRAMAPAGGETSAALLADLEASAWETRKQMASVRDVAQRVFAEAPRDADIASLKEAYETLSLAFEELEPQLTAIIEAYSPNVLYAEGTAAEGVGREAELTQASLEALLDPATVYDADSLLSALEQAIDEASDLLAILPPTADDMATQ